MYADAKTGVPMETARLISPPFSAPAYDHTWELTFSYHMFGEHINELTVSVVGEQTIHLLTLRSSMSREWQKARVYVEPFVGDARIVFRAVRGNGFRGDIAIDDVFLTKTDIKKVDGK